MYIFGNWVRAEFLPIPSYMYTYTYGKLGAYRIFIYIPVRCAHNPPPCHFFADCKLNISDCNSFFKTCCQEVLKTRVQQATHSQWIF